MTEYSINIQDMVSHFELYEYILHKTDWDEDDIKDVITHSRLLIEKRKIARNLLMCMVRERYQGIGPKVKLHHEEYDKLFPMNYKVRTFAITLVFKDKNDLNRLKLTRPSTYYRIKNSMGTE